MATTRHAGEADLCVATWGPAPQMLHGHSIFPPPHQAEPKLWASLFLTTQYSDSTNKTLK